MSGPLDAGMSEAERRTLVRNIRDRGKRGYEVRDAVVAPTVDYAALAQEAFAGDPVNVGDATLAALAGKTDQVATDANRYAEAQRAIFEQGQGRELGYGNAYYDAMPTLIESTKDALAKYEEQMSEAAAARSRGGGGGYSYRSSGGLPSLPNLGDDPQADTGSGYRQLSVGQMVAEYGPMTSSFINTGISKFLPVNQFMDDVSDYLLNSTDVHPDSVMAYAQGLVATYRGSVERYIEETGQRLRREGSNPNLIEQYLASLRTRFGIGGPRTVRERRMA